MWASRSRRMTPMESRSTNVIFGVLQGSVALDPEAKPGRASHMWHEPCQEPPSLSVKRSLPRAAAEVEGRLEVVLGGEGNHRVVGDILRPQDLVEEERGSQRRK